MESVNHATVYSSNEKHYNSSPGSPVKGSSVLRIPLKTAMIKYRDNKQIADAQAATNKQKLLDTLRPFSNQVFISPKRASLDAKQLEFASNASKATTSANTKLVFDPSMTYVPPIKRGVVDTVGGDPRDRLKELYKYYNDRGDYNIMSTFLRRRDWVEVPSRLRELKKR